jgi:hypothetical protein
MPFFTGRYWARGVVNGVILDEVGWALPAVEYRLGSVLAVILRRPRRLALGDCSRHQPHLTLRDRELNLSRQTIHRILRLVELRLTERFELLSTDISKSSKKNREPM